MLEAIAAPGSTRPQQSGGGTMFPPGFDVVPDAPPGAHELVAVIRSTDDVEFCRPSLEGESYWRR